MTRIELPDELRRNAELVFGDDGARWFADLPEQIERYVRRWELHLDCPRAGSPGTACADSCCRCAPLRTNRRS